MKIILASFFLFAAQAKAIPVCHYDFKQMQIASARDDARCKNVCIAKINCTDSELSIPPYSRYAICNVTDTNRCPTAVSDCIDDHDSLPIQYLSIQNSDNLPVINSNNVTVE